MPGDDFVIYQKVIQASPEQIFRAFTSSTALREWLCDVATTNPEVGGRIFLAWNKGYFASGHYTNLIPGQQVEFTWIGKDEPVWTRVSVAIKNLDDDKGCLVEPRHSGLGFDTEWEKAREEITTGWEAGLENLRSTLEEGLDLRLLQRPLIGIYPEEVANLNHETKARLGISFNDGVFVLDVVPGYGGEKAGIKSNDVIYAIDGRKVDSIRTLSSIMNESKPGDSIAIDVFRGTEKLTFIIDTMAQAFEDLPGTPESLAREVEKRSLEVLERLEKILAGITESEASFSPGAEEWSIKDILVHLIHTEREIQSWITDLVGGQERHQDEWTGNQLFRIRATLASYPTLDELLDQLRRSLKESIALVAFIDPSFTERKASYHRLGNDLLGYSKHFEEHIKQITENIEVARKSKP